MTSDEMSKKFKKALIIAVNVGCGFETDAEDAAELLTLIVGFESRIAELEAENIRLGIEYQRMRLALGDIAINSKRALNESPTDHLTARWRQERQDDKWIPVSERLPEANKCVLVYDAGGNMTVDFLVTSGEVEKYFWLAKYRILFWMPLPESPNDTQTSTIVYGKECEE